MPYSIQGTDYTYLTFKSVLRAVRRHNLANPARPIRKLLCTGLGTFYGKMPLGEAARQMALAYRGKSMRGSLVCSGANVPARSLSGFMHPPSSLTWDFASERQRSVGYGGHPGFVKFQRAVAAAVAAATASAKANKSKRGRAGAGAAVAAAATAGDAAASEESRRRIMAEMYKLAAEMETK